MRQFFFLNHISKIFFESALCQKFDHILLYFVRIDWLLRLKGNRSSTQNHFEVFQHSPQTFWDLANFMTVRKFKTFRFLPLNVATPPHHTIDCEGEKISMHSTTERRLAAAMVSLYLSKTWQCVSSLVMSFSWFGGLANFLYCFTYLK